MKEYLQIYDGNLKKAVGHLFESEVQTSVCGRKKAEMSAPCVEREWNEEQLALTSWVQFSLARTCVKCSRIAQKRLKSNL